MVINLIFLINRGYLNFFGMNIPFISSSEAKNAYFMSGKARNGMYIFSLLEMK